MGLTRRISMLVKQKVNSLLNRFEDPKEALDYSYQKQTELMIKLRRDIANVVAAKKRLEMQKAKLKDNIYKLEQQARSALEMNREDLARLALERKNMNIQQLLDVERQIADMEKEQVRLEELEKRLSAKVEQFKLQKEIIKAKYTAAEAEVRIKESVTGISEEMADVGMAIQRAEEKTEQMKARAMALDELMDSGVLTDYTTNKDMIERELQDVMMRDAVEKELERLRKEMGKGEVKEAQKVKRGKKGSEVSTEAEAETETNSS
ncbi:MAG: PspA/IM30 family protein [Candidatus Nitrosocaldus sp.]